MQLTEAQLRKIIREALLIEGDPPRGRGRKPPGSDRRLYTDEDPTDTVKVRFRTRADVVSTLSKPSFRAKSHARQSQIINLIHQRLRVAHDRAKDPDTRRRLKRALDYITVRKERSKERTQQLKRRAGIKK